MTTNVQFSSTERTKALQTIAREGIDVLVIGGGITGAGVALDAAARGFRTALVEKTDFGSGTSSKSTKLVHGGIRYLPQFDFALVREALVERGLLVRNAPFLVQPIGFVLPLYKDTKRPLGTPIVPPFGIGMGLFLQAGLLFYDLLSGRLGVRMHRRLGVQKALALVPGLRKEGLITAFIYYDAQTDDTLLTSTVLRTAAQQGAQIANYTEVTGFTQASGTITHAILRDVLSDETLTVKVGTVINAGGVFAGKIEALAGQSDIVIKPAKGVHITVARERIQLGAEAVVLPETEDGRLLFLVPWGPRITVGTTDTVGGDVEHPIALEADIDYLIRHVNQYLTVNLTTKDVISSWASYRPLISKSGSSTSSSKLSRTHIVAESASGMLTIVGGKLTTYRRMAQDVVDVLCRKRDKPIAHVTRDLPLIGSKGWREAANAVEQAAAQWGFSAETVTRLSKYGGEAHTILDLLRDNSALAMRIVPDLPYIMAEVVFACRYEMAITLADVLERRLHLNFEDWARGVGTAPAVARVMARELGWDAAHTAQQVEAYCAAFGTLAAVVAPVDAVSVT